VHEEVNVEGTRLVVAAAREAGVHRMVHASSVIVYGVDSASPVVTESNPLDRSCRRCDRYVRTKVAAEDAARDEADGPPGPELVILRFGILYGYERPLDPGIVTIGAVRLTMGGGRNHLPFTHVDDAVNAVLLAATVDAAVGNAYNVVGEGEVTVRDAIRLVSREDGAGRRVVGVLRDEWSASRAPLCSPAHGSLNGTPLGLAAPCRHACRASSYAAPLGTSPTTREGSP
jgi:nucleoside-diphosphate-sugar epimerase